MKLLMATICVTSSFALRAAGLNTDDLALHKARMHGALAKECLRVVDQDGRPVAGAKIWGGLQTGSGHNDFVPIRGTTDTNGEYVIEGKCTSRIRCDITKDGYYRSEFLMTNYGHTHSLKDGKWQPYGETETVVLKKQRNPGRTLVFPDELRSCRIPEFGKWIAFDFQCADWVAPCGKGRNSDVLLRFSAMERSMDDYRFSMEVSFTNNPHAGAYRLKEDKTSVLTTVYDADSNATYRAEFAYIQEEKPNGLRHFDYLDHDSYLVFRTRTRVDKDGNLVGAHYGKILGRWLSDTEYMILSDGCFNPVENDVNIEDGSGLRDAIRNQK